MMSWSPTARREAGAGLVALWSRPEWRTPPYAERIEANLRLMLSDDDEVQRLQAAQVVHLLERDRAAGLTLIHERLRVEPHAYVAAVLLDGLWTFRIEHPDEVDRIVADVLDREPWATVVRVGFDNIDRHEADSLVRLVIWLAIRPQTTNAVALAQGWFTHPVDSEAGRRCIWLVRDWLALPPERSEERHRAFELARTAATALQAVADDLDDETRAKVAYQSAVAMAHAAYFASGAFGEQGQNPTPAPAGFAEEAFDLLELLTAFRHPSIVHEIVQTAEHLAPENPKRAFGIVYRAVRSGEPYSYDQMAADVVVSLVERYLADFRETVVTDVELLSQVRSVLDAFVRVGWPAAVSLSYGLGAVFR